jgi:alpha-tubulin suppressor-like RCC1 family protein
MVGTTTVVREQFEGQGIDEKNYMTHSDIDMLQDIPSMPFQIEFRLPIAKVACGDTNYALLSCSGQVFTWGNNRYSQLGIDNSEIVMQMRPDETRPLEFKSESSSRSQHIIDIEASYGSFIALSEEQ